MSFLQKFFLGGCLTVALAMQAQAQCNAPGVSVLGVYDDSVSLSWTTVTGAAGYEYAILPATASAPTSGTPILTTSLGMGQLSYSAYKAWVRTDCGGGNFSSWASVTFNVTCGVPAISLTNITQTSVDINWTAISNTATYEYIIDQSPDDPTSSGTLISATSITINSLIPGSTYYAHFRTNCNSTTNSSWTSQSFVTLFPAGINTVNNDLGTRVYPNPVNNEVNIWLNNSKKTTITLTDLFGKTIHSCSPGNNQTTINMQSLPPGIYIIRCQSEDDLKTYQISKL